MKITGELLRAERLKQDLKITDVAFALKLSSKVIQAIESGDSELLPAKTFVRGFVKSYAEFLKLDSAIVLKQFQEEMGSTSPVPKSPPPMPEIIQQASAPEVEKRPREKLQAQPQILNGKINSGFTQKHIFILIFVGLLVFILGLVNHFVNKYSKERVTVATNVSVPVKVDPPEAITPTASLSTSGDTAAAEVSSADNSNSSAAAASVAVAPPEKTTAPPPTEPQMSTTEFPALAKSNGKPVEVLVEAKKDTVLQFAKGNSNTFEKILVKENSYQIIRSQNGLHLRADDGSHFVLTVNGVTRTVSKSSPFQITF